MHNKQAFVDNFGFGDGMEQKKIYDVKNPKWFDGENLAKYLKKELKGKPFKIKFSKSAGGNGAIMVNGNPSKMMGELPDGWSYDPSTRKIRNGNKANAEYFDVKPLKDSKPLGNIVDMSDVLYLISCKRPDIKVKALDTTSIGIDGADIMSIDWKKIFGSKFVFDKSTGTLQGETNEGIKLAFNVLGEKFNNRKFETVSEEKYKANAYGVMQSCFSEGNRKSVENTASSLTKELSTLNPHALMMQADLHTFSSSDARFLFDTYNLVPDPRGGLNAQERATGVVLSDPSLVSRLAIVYTLAETFDKTTTTENNPLINSVTRGKINWEKFDKMFEAFIASPDALGVVVEKSAMAMEEGGKPQEIREEVNETLAEKAEELKENQETTASPDEKKTDDITAVLEENNAPKGVLDGVKLKAGGGLVTPTNIDDDRLPMSYAQLKQLDFSYERTVVNGKTVGVVEEKTGENVDESQKDMILWMLVKDALDNRFGGDLVSAENYWNNLISSPNWQAEAFAMVREFERLNAMDAREKEDEVVMERTFKPNGDKQ